MSKIQASQLMICVPRKREKTLRHRDLHRHFERQKTPAQFL